MSKSQEVAKDLQRRRMRGRRLLVKGVAQAELACRVGVSRTTVSTWNRDLQSEGLEGLRAGVRGWPSKLEHSQKAELLKALLKGALAEGFPTADLWTLSRIATLIQRRWKHRYSESQVWHILTGLRFSSQRPSSRALERNEPAIKRWKRERWSALTKTLSDKVGSSSSSTSRD